jgi:hypothetical protein
MYVRSGFVAAIGAVLVTGVVGCGGSHTSSTTTTVVSTVVSTVVPTSVPATGSPSSSGTQQPAAAAPVIDITIANGQVKPIGATVQAKVGQAITVNVTSDANDELHVDTDPDHKFKIVAAPNQTFRFTADRPGVVEVELDNLDRTVALIQVSP